ncbi:MAG: glycoside hydrolase family 13 protein [Intrasporangium sp.]|uniref:glycoside hydrolase family 13 protein n=1 Tax=Intrasporangium sp. TaxID=1925024 RepID=UPI002648FC12|nr:glycoside hydrolase family 13 protein [Intrasporangium sp.]MDN5795294.1 glycoside hydrolase family 13 protein [Intrasporangium sp.]
MRNHDPVTRTASHPAIRPEVALHPVDDNDTWWRSAVIYQIYPRSWADSDGDGMGDLPGITARLEHLTYLGADAIWLSPFYPSPQADAGYDVADYRDVDPRFGTLADADALVARAHELRLKVIVDLVPNHSSDEHAWFRAALAAGPGSPERERYHFRDGKGRRGTKPPNNWESVFGGTAWTRVTERDGRPGQWYLHLFDPKQPDFNWDHQQVRAEFESVLRFWLDRGIDGFRVDVAHGLVKKPGLPDWSRRTNMLGDTEEAAAHVLDATEPQPTHLSPCWDQDGVHEIYRSWRAVLDSYGGPDRILCAEAWVEPPERAVLYTRPDEMHQAFNFDFLLTPWIAQDLVAVIQQSLAAADSVGAPSTWVLSNHDVVRHATRLGYAPGTKRRNGIGADDPQPDRKVGLKRARAATALMLALPGGAYLYQGEELGLPDSTTMPDEARQDPTYLRSGGAELGRDGCRVPMPWARDAPGFGFGPSAGTWLPQPEVYGAYAADQQRGVADSTLELYRTLLRVRRELGLGRASLALVDGYAADVVALEAVGPGGARVLVVANLGTAAVQLPEGVEVLVTSGRLDGGGAVPTDTTVWARWR